MNDFLRGQRMGADAEDDGSREVHEDGCANRADRVEAE
jgi:hypothetical protein